MESDISKKMIIIILIIAILAIVGALIFYRSLDFLPFALGVLIGTAGSVARVLLVKRTVTRALKMEAKDVGRYVNAQAFIRLGLAVAILLIAALVPQINLWGAAIGIIAFHPAIYIANKTVKNPEVQGTEDS
ncbi:MAG: ATP synthase subunit I [Saccharofermentanales bacterium]|jgi:MFS-type transporter involved in bile tolerance (Atg22 family)|nr:ATP synthase subunit I [Eubacteriales bacterium]MDD3611165.1 ATP synthase subunit I [Eubacteriales bacterium]HHU04382.1 hypothetical protein [Fastidiosipila sp.]